MLEHMTNGFITAITPENVLFMLAGTAVGLVFAAIPGLTFSTALVLLIPLTFDLPAICAISLLLGVFSGGMAGGSVSSILLGIPGTPSAAATVLDGHMMAKKGEGGMALGMAVFASVFGGIFSLLVLMLIAPQLASVALTFGSPEIFAMLVFGLSTIVSLSGDSMLKGLLAGTLGLLFTMVGLDPILGIQRFVYGRVELMEGINIMPVMIGMFALPEIVNTFQMIRNKKEQARAGGEAKKGAKAVFPSWRTIRQTFPLLVASSAIGTGLGAIPGTGGPIASFLAYDVARKRYPLCGTGIIEGVAAPESANNGVTGGSLIPLLTLGIPGDSATAIILGAFLIHGIAPGPLLFKDNPELIYAIFGSIIVINVMILVIQFFGIKLFVRLLDVPKLALMSTILVLSVVGAYAVKMSYTDVLIMWFSGLLGYLMKKTGFSVTPLILALVLGRDIESHFRKALLFSSGDPLIFISSPVSVAFLLLSGIMLLTSSGVYRQIRAKISTGAKSGRN